MSAAPPLAGVQVVDCSDFSPGPYATQLLGDLGADVLLVERPPAADAPREDPDVLALDQMRRGKRSLVVDLKQQEGVAIVRRLVASADVFIEGWRPGVAARLGLGFDRLRRENERLVYCSISGYGQRGPNRDLPGHDLNYLAFSGLLGMVAEAETGPVPPLNVVADYAGGGLAAAFAIVTALFARTRGGDLRHLDVSMTDAVISFLGPHLARGSLAGEFRAAGAHGLAGSLPFYRSYRCSDDGWLAVSALEPRFFAALCDGLGRPELADLHGRPRSYPELAQELEAAFASDTRDAWFERLRPHSCVAPVLRPEELAEHPAYAGTGRLAEVSAGGRSALHAGGLPGFPTRPAGRPGPGPLRGADGDAVLRELGYDDDAIAGLKRRGALGASLRPPTWTPAA